MTIELHQFYAPPGFPNLSPFCMKVETWLKLAGLDYTIRWQMTPNGPYGKLPVVRDNGELIADSHSIIDTLAKRYGKNLDAGLDARQKAVVRALERLLSEHLYWAAVYFRWIDAETWPRTRSIMFAKLPAPLRVPIGVLARRGIQASLKGHGLGRLPREEILRRAAQDIDALAGWLGEQPYFMGAEPTTIDASAYAFLANLHDAPLQSPLRPLVAAHPNLVAYCARMRARCFGDAASSRSNNK